MQRVIVVSAGDSTLAVSVVKCQMAGRIHYGLADTDRMAPAVWPLSITQALAELSGLDKISVIH